MKTRATRSLFALLSVVSLGCATGKTGSKGTMTAREAAAALKADPSLIGRWEGVDDGGKLGAFLFREDGIAVMEMGGEKLGDPNDGGPRGLKWVIDKSHTPPWLDLVGFDRISGAVTGRMLWVMEFPDDNSLRLRTFFTDQRPMDFSGATDKDTLTLHRMVNPAK